MARITTSEAPKATVAALAKVAKENNRTPAREALVAVQAHVLNQIALPKPKKP